MSFDAEIEDESTPCSAQKEGIDFSASLRRLRSQLLDLTAKNRLVHFRYTRRSLRFVNTSLYGPYKSLLEGKPLRLTYVPMPPDQNETETIAVNDYAIQLGLPTSYELEKSEDSMGHLQTLLYPKDLDRIIRIIHDENRLATDESGSHILFLVSGFLKYKMSETINSSEFIAPLLLLPVQINRNCVDPVTGLYTYNLSVLEGEEGIKDNITLREKLSLEFGFQLPLYEELQSPSSYLDAVSDSCSNRRGWEVLPHLSLVLVSFKKIALWADLDLEHDQMVLEHPIMKKLFGFEEGGGSNEGLGDDHLVDNHPLAEIPFIYDADCSQHSALIDALEGKNLVIIGPPGTGKSQTITNLIAAAMGRGKNVLFISDKKAALEVVSKRIELAGLGPFCLELHSNKSCKKVVLGSLEQRLNQTFPIMKNNDDLRSLRELRSKLNSYAVFMNQVIDIPGEFTVHDIFWKVEKARLSLSSSVDRLHNIWWSDAVNWKAKDLNDRRQILSDLGLHHNQLEHEVSQHPLWGITSKTVSPIDKNQIECVLHEGLKALESLHDSMSKLFNEDLSGSISIDNCSLWLAGLHRAKCLGGIDINIINSLENSLQNATSNTIEDTLTLIRALSLSMIESNKLLPACGSVLRDFPLTQSPIVDMPISRLSALAQNLASTLSLGGELLQSSSIRDYENLVVWFSSNDRRQFLTLSKQKLQSVLIRISHLLNSCNTFELYKNGDCKKLDYSDLEKNITNSENLTEQLVNGLKSLLPLQEGLSLKEMKISTLNLLVVCNEIFSSAPRSFFSIRASRLSTNHSNALSSIFTEAKMLIEDQQKLSSSFLFDLVPTTKVLENSLKIIQEASWWSFFSRSVFRAKKICSSLFRKVEGIDTSPQELDRLLLWCKCRDSFLSDPFRRELFGTCFTGEESDIRAELESLSIWWANACCRLKELPDGQTIDLFLVSDDTINRLETSRKVIHELIQVKAHLQRQVSILNSYYRELEELSILTAMVVHSGSTIFSTLVDAYQHLMTSYSELSALGKSVDSNTKWSDLRNSMNDQLTEIEFIFLHCQGMAPVSLTPRQIKSAINARQRVVDLRTSLQADELLNSLILRLESIDFDKLEIIDKTFSWCLEVKASGVPVILERRLFDKPFELEIILDAIQGVVFYVQKWKIAIEKLLQLTTVDSAFWAIPGKEITLDEISSAKKRFERACKGIDNIVAWCAYNRCKEYVISLGLLDLIHHLESGYLTSSQLDEAFEYLYHRSCVQYLYRQFPDISRETGYTLDDIRKRFSELDSKIIRLNGTRLAENIARRQVPEGRRAARAKEQTELVLLKHEMAKDRRHLPIRKLMMQAGRAIQALKPCFLMSPLSVAQYLPKSALSFDLLIIDEASQMRLPEAFGAILRSKQIVVVGDPKQLPPSNFFEHSTNDDQEEEDNLGAIEDGVHSILERCLQVFTAPRRLRWHYRSQHQNLIAFSNYHFYDNRLVVLPACHPVEARMGVHYNYISDSIYLNRCNRIEAEKIIEAVTSQLLKDSTSSVGVVTLNQPQRELISEMFEQRLRNTASLREIVDQFEAVGKSVFVKNLENVQGDERDIIFISTVYGRAPGSTVVRQGFGPINGSSGWRRLNVLFTRARQRIELFSSMQPEDIIVNDKSSLGLRILKQYLEFAQNCLLTQINPSSGEAESPFEEAVADLLSLHGYEVHLQLGVRGYWIDIAVRHPEKPGEFLAAIECDGATYHSSRSARDRDRIRQKLLEDLGWKGKIFRIWSTDWFSNPIKQSNNLLDFLASLRFLKPLDE